MKISSFIDFKKKYKNGPFRWQVIELYRLGVIKERQVLIELDLSLSSLRAWNRAYQRYRLRRYYPTSRFRRPIQYPFVYIVIQSLFFVRKPCSTILI